MSTSKKVSILYFSDVLCIWAYLAQIRMDELKKKFGDKINVELHFIPVFGSVKSKMEANWKDRGGVRAYGKWVFETATKFKHVDVHEHIWQKNIPLSSASCHLFIKAAQLADEKGLLPKVAGQCHVERLTWSIRQAFFQDLTNVSKLSEQLNIAERLGLPVDAIQGEMSSGAAFAALNQDFLLKETYRVTGSPTLVFNEGRQIIYGNVGYRVIEANIQELLKEPVTSLSWC